MLDLLRWLLSQLESEDDQERSKDTARQRLSVVLIQDRLDLPIDKMAAMKREIWDVVSRYLVVDDDFLEFEIRRLDELVVLVSNIQVKDTTELASAQ